MARDKPKAVIWDMDGVIVDTAIFHMKSWQGVFQRRGVNFSEEDFKRHFGQRNDIIIRDALGPDVPQSEMEAISREKEEDFRNMIRKDIKALPGAIKLIELLVKDKYKLAVVSSAPRKNMQLFLTGLNIDSYFSAVVCDEDVTEGKPSPQGFLLAAQKLEVEPKNCIVIEDAIAGVAAAKRAGMHCLAVTNTHPRTSLMEADLIVDTVETVSVPDLERLMGRSYNK